MSFSRQIYEDLPDFIPVPAELKHRKAEVIILSLESQPFIKQKVSLQTMLAELAAINKIEPIEIDCPPRIDRANPLLDEN